ncbi:MAG: DUF1573 domain-containing protein [Flavobacteriales bacterium]|nr:DUF1573 domain-containing protein [Flavobacteriales bacterium]
MNRKKGAGAGARAGGNATRLSLLLPLFLLLAFTSCRLTDHRENDPAEITTDAVQFPSSGYRNVDQDDLPKMEFTTTHVDFGRIVQGAKVETSYTFKNTGGSPLVISDVRGSCGCTVGKDWPKEPVPPGGKATISVSFDSEGRNGRQDKTVTVVANTVPPSNVLTLTAEVVGPTSKP